MAKKTKKLTLRESNILRNALEQRYFREFNTELLREGVKGAGETDEFKKLGAKIEDELKKISTFVDERSDSGITLSPWFKTLFYLTKEKSDHNFEYYAINKVCYFLEGVDADTFFNDSQYFGKYTSEEIEESNGGLESRDSNQCLSAMDIKYKSKYNRLIFVNICILSLGLLAYLYDYKYYNWLWFAPEPKHNIWVAVYSDTIKCDTIYIYNTFRTYRSKEHINEYFYSSEPGDDDAFYFVTPTSIKKMKGYSTTKEFADKHGGKPMVFRLTGL